MRIISTDTPQVFIMLTTILQLFTELVVSGMLIVVVFIMAPEITIIMAVILLLLTIIINRILKPILRRAGKETQDALSGMNKWLLQSIQGIKAGKEEFFEENFNKHGSKYLSSLRKNYILGITPRFFIEAICMSAVFVLVGIFIYRGADIETMIPILTAVAVAAMRLLPSVNRVSSGLANISYNEPMLDKLIENLKDISGKEDVSLAMTFDSEEDVEENKRHLPKLSKKVLFNNIS